MFVIYYELFWELKLVVNLVMFFHFGSLILHNRKITWSVKHFFASSV